ncbi:MAG TPA: 3-methyl-2-oxobutanoate hydroxymethyltransferase [Longimicrobiales bacterium]|nr:3-methyl-2-oxobutanoate hydroxymethyltransferase [Longimicrobiales bacterium]
MSTTGAARTSKVTVRDLLEMKSRGEKIVVLTAYDYLFGKLVDENGADVVLVGDSLAQVVLGYDSTLPVTIDDMIHHARAVRRGVQKAMLVVDMPFLSFQISAEETLRNAGRILKETGCEAVKLEGGDEQTADGVRALVRAGIPVMGHIGLTPQSVHAVGGYRVQGRERADASRIKEEATRLQAAGCFSIVLELMPATLAADITRALQIPTIGIGAGPEVDGQVLVLYDMLGLNDGFKPKFLRRFGNIAEQARTGIQDFARAVRDGSYPAAEHSFD